MRASTWCVAFVVASLVTGVGVVCAEASEDCMAPDAPDLPLTDEPRTRIIVNSYLDDANDYFACTGDAADPRAVVEYERVVMAWTQTIRVWGTTRGGPLHLPPSRTGDPVGDFLSFVF